MMHVEAVFNIVASNRDVFYNRVAIIERLTGFNYVENEHRGRDTVWKIIMTGYVPPEDLKNGMRAISRRGWFFDRDAVVYDEHSKEVYCDGEWLI